MKRLIALSIFVLCSSIAVGLILGASAKSAPTPVASPVTATITPEAISANAIYDDVNIARHNAGVPPLADSPELTTSAQQKCADMTTTNYYAHQNPATGKQGYSYVFSDLPNVAYASENLNLGNLPTNQAFVDSWLASPAHKAAMLDPKYTVTGLATCYIPKYPNETAVVEHFAEVSTNQ